MGKLTNAKVLVIGGAGFIGSHVVGELLKTDVGQVVVYDNFARGKKAYLDPYHLPRETMRALLTCADAHHLTALVTQTFADLGPIIQ